MSNGNEERVKKSYEENGYTVIHSGAPDFLCFKRGRTIINDERIVAPSMIEIIFVEVKSRRDKLSKNQLLWKEALTRMQYHYVVEKSDGWLK